VAVVVEDPVLVAAEAEAEVDRVLLANETEMHQMTKKTSLCVPEPDEE
jgi:hypothetical protein